MRGNRLPVERSKRGVIRHAAEVYGRSHDGTTLTVWLPKEQDPKLLVLASIQGDESETTYAERFLRTHGTHEPFKLTYVNASPENDYGNNSMGSRREGPFRRSRTSPMRRICSDDSAGVRT